MQSRRRQDPASGIQRCANVIGWQPGFVSLAEVRTAFGAGVDPRDAAWMWRRLLVVLRSRGPTAADKDLVAPLPALTREPAEPAGYLGGRAADRTGHRGDPVGRDAEARA